MTAAAAKLKDANTPVKPQFDALAKQFDAVRVKFGVPAAPAGGRGGGGGGGRGNVNLNDVLAHSPRSR